MEKKYITLDIKKIYILNDWYSVFYSYENLKSTWIKPSLLFNYKRRANRIIDQSNTITVFKDFLYTQLPDIMTSAAINMFRTKQFVTYSTLFQFHSFIHTKSWINDTVRVIRSTPSKESTFKFSQQKYISFSM